MDHFEPNLRKVIRNCSTIKWDGRARHDIAPTGMPC